MWSLSGNYVGFGWKDVSVSGLGDDTDAHSAAHTAQQERSEELEVYECMVRYLDAHCRAIKACLAALPADASLQHVVFFLPPPAGQGGSALDALDHADGGEGGQMGGDGLNNADGGNGGGQTGSNGREKQNQHPFLAKCKRIFAEVFQ